jgi:transposase
LQTINHVLLMEVREAAGRKASPTAGVIDSQSVKSPRGYAAEKMIKGRKRHILTDTIGLPVGMIVHPANVQDRDGAPGLLARVRNLYPWLRHVFADGGYAGDKLKAALEGARQLDHRDRQALRRGQRLRSAAPPLGRGAHNCLAEPNRRLAKDVGATIESSVTWLYIASVKLMSRRLAAV